METNTDMGLKDLDKLEELQRVQKRLTSREKEISIKEKAIKEKEKELNEVTIYIKSWEKDKWYGIIYIVYENRSEFNYFHWDTLF